MRSGAEFCTRSFNRHDEILPGHWLRVEWLRDWSFKWVIFPFPVYRHFAFLKSHEVPNKFALKVYITWNLYLFVFTCFTGKNNRFPFLDILGCLKNTHKNPKFGRVRQVPTRELGWEFPGWDLSHFAKFGIFVGIL